MMMLYYIAVACMLAAVLVHSDEETSRVLKTKGFAPTKSPTKSPKGSGPKLAMNDADSARLSLRKGGGGGGGGSGGGGNSNMTVR